MKNRKFCVRCKTLKTVSKFGLNVRNCDGLQKYCRDCRKVSDKRSYDKRKKSILNTVRARKQKILLWFNEFKSQCRCIDCGNTDPRVLEFHHTRDKRHHIASMVTQGYSIKSIQAEIAKCNVLCANCHRLTHAKIARSLESAMVKQE